MVILYIFKINQQINTMNMSYKVFNHKKFKEINLNVYNLQDIIDQYIH